MKTILRRFTKYKYLLVSIVFAVLAILDLANFGIPPTHDGEYHVMRFWQFSKMISEGNLYPRWAPDFNNGFGIPLFNYVYPLPNYVAAVFHAIGFGFIDSFKLNMATATITGAIFMYLWSKKYWKETGALVSSVFYTFSPYHLLDIYVRGSVGEVWSLALAPGLYWAYLNYVESRKEIYFVLSSVMLSLLILSHNILATVFFGFFILYAGFNIWKNKNKKTLVYETLLISCFGLGISSPFWLPAIFETKYVVGLQVFDPTQHFPVLYKLIYSSWGYGFSGINVPNQMSFQIGIANLVVVLGSIVALFKFKSKSVIIFFISVLSFTVFLITPFSEFIWKNISELGYIQFPWRFLSLVILITAFLAGSLTSLSFFKNRNRNKIIFGACLIVLSVGLSFRYAKAPFYHKRIDQHYLVRANFTDGTNSPGDAFNTKWILKIPEKRKEKIEALSKNTKIKISETKLTHYTFTVESIADSKILINTAYFPGWVYEINGRIIPAENIQGKIGVLIPVGKTKVDVFLSSTLLQKISYFIFLISVLLLVLFRSRTTVIIKK